MNSEKDIKKLRNVKNPKAIIITTILIILSINLFFFLNFIYFKMTLFKEKDIFNLEIN